MHADLTEENQRDLKTCNDACLRLIENFDAVQIFATRHEGDKGTIRVEVGRGNWFARLGHISAWLDSQDMEAEDV